MARRRTRRNPATTGAVVVNPRRKRKNTRKAKRRSNPLAIRTNSRRRKATKRKNALAVRTNKRRTVRRRRANPLAIRTNKRRRKSTRRANPRMHKRRVNRSHKRRSNPRRRYSRKNALAVRTNKRRVSRRRSHRTRRNPGLVASIKSFAGKVPVLGGFLGTAIGFALPALFGAIGVIPTAFVAKKLAPYMPFVDARLFYVLSALGLAALVQKFAPFDAKLKRDLALGIATGGAAVALYKHATGAGGTLSGEYGQLEYGGMFGDEGYAVIPGYAGFGDYGDDDMGAYTVIPGYGQEAL